MSVLKKYEEKGAYYQFGESGSKFYVEENGEEEALKMALQEAKTEESQIEEEKAQEEAKEELVTFQKDSFFIEINRVNLDDVAGRTKIKMSAHEIYRDQVSYNKNGITWTEKGTEENIRSAIGMPYIARFLDSEQEIPYDHGTQEYDEEGNVSFSDSEQVGSVQKAYIEEINGKLLLMTEGYLSNQRYPKFVKWLKNVIEQGQNIFGSVEINGKGNSKTIVYENGRTNPDGSLKIGRKPLVYDYTGLAILYGEEPADNLSQVYEINSKSLEEERLMEFEKLYEQEKKLYEQEVEKNQNLESEKDSLIKKVEETEAKILEKDEAIVNATKVLKEKEDELAKLQKDIAEVNAKYEEKLAKEKETEVNAYFETIKDLFEEDEVNALKAYVEAVDLIGLKSKEAEICTAKFKSMLVKKEDKKTVTESETNALFTVSTEEVETIEYKSLSDIQ